MSVPFIGLGTQVEFASVLSPASFTNLLGVTSVAFSGDKTSTIKTTNMLTTSGVDTYISGTTEPGTVDVKALLQPGDASLIALEALRNSGAAVPFEVVYPLSLGSVTFSGIVESITRSIPLDKEAVVDIKIKITGVVTASNG
ncbi:MAG TPA: phage tail tube protein [Terriglobales bacterium]|nr:phage tail tube protein [Terriglobales bacterium]